MNARVLLVAFILAALSGQTCLASEKQNMVTVSKVSANPQAQAAFREGMMRLSNHHYRKAISFFSMAIAADKQIASAYFQRAECYQQLENFDDAFKDINTALSIDPKFGGAYHIRADLRFQRHELEKAIEDMNKACQFEPNVAGHFYARAKLFEIADKNEKAWQDYRHCLDLKDNETNAAFRLGNLEMKLGKYEDAANHFTRYMNQAHPEDLEASYQHRAMCYAKLGKNELAKKDREKARHMTENGWGEIFRPQK